MKSFFLFILIFVNTFNLFAGDYFKEFCIISAKIYTVTQGVIEDGYIIIKNSKIYEIAKYSDNNNFENYHVIEAKGKVIIPGLIDSHTHAGIITFPLEIGNLDLVEAVNSVLPNVRVIDAINPKDPIFKKSVKGGITTVAIRHGSSNLIGGVSVALKLGSDKLEDMVLNEKLNLKMAFGMNPKFSANKRNTFPQTRMGYTFLIRDLFKKTQAYIKKWQDYKSDSKKYEKPEKDETYEILSELLQKKLPAHIHCARADDILFAMELAEEFGFDFNLAHVFEGDKVAAEIAMRKISVVTGPLLSGWDQGKGQLYPINYTGILADAGVKVSIMTDYRTIDPEDLLFHVLMAVRLGLDINYALKTVTINPAELIGLSDRIGSLEVGKDADIVLLSGEPFDPATVVEKVFINGILRYSSETN